ncbi:tail tubular protein B [Xanthomonas phage PBR31]|uniref:Tail tubular protein B n=1 Tax=Xanthomonas phage PPDBI TaxID=2723911 RepID=A0A6H0X5Q6_9CAUD|nr:tail tubular protein B [Xanthomonas phage PBR31]QIW89385.1 tail tubular protein B [Xanthomonas phage PPDBI]
MPQFPFVGQAYEAPMLLQDAEKCVNWYVEVSQNQESKTPVALLGTPGLNLLLTLGSGPVRGFWVMPGEVTAIAVSGNAVYWITIQTPANATTNAVLQGVQIGTLQTSSGPVVIRDNGAGGIAVIVDGPNGYVVNAKSQTVKQITDPAWLGSDRVRFIDGWLIFNRPGTQTFYTSPIYWDGVQPLNATYFALKDTSTDNLVSHEENNRELWLFGERTIEVWCDAGNPNFPFSRLQGVKLQHGCAAKHSLCRIADSLMWLGKDENGQNVVLRTSGYQAAPVSSIGVNHAIASYPVISDAIAYAYQEDEHWFYVLTFPTADVTWVYDMSTKLWHERLSYDPLAGLFHRHWSNCYMNFAGMRIVGDFQNGNIYQMSRQFYSDNGNPLVAWRRTPHLWDKNNRERVFNQRMQIEFTPGVGLQTGQGQNPQIMMRWSNDGGQTWSNEHWQSVGLVGETKHRAIWRRLGSARDRVYEVKFSDPVPRDVVGASIRAE